MTSFDLAGTWYKSPAIALQGAATTVYFHSGIFTLTSGTPHLAGKLSKSCRKSDSKVKAVRQAAIWFDLKQFYFRN